MKLFFVLGAEIALVTAFILYDYSSAPAAETAWVGRIAALMIIGVVLLNKYIKKFTNASEASHLYSNVVLLVYTLTLLFVEALLGRTSSFGLSVNNPFLWIIVGITFYQLYNDWKEIKKNKVPA